MIEDLLTEISERNWRVNNLFQRSDSTWQANLRSATHHTEFALADSPALALALAIDQIERAIESDKPAPTKVFTESFGEFCKNKSSVEAYLRRLRPVQPCDRRI